MLTNALFANAGVPGQCWTAPPELTGAGRATGRSAVAWQRVFGAGRLLIALLASVLLWLGWYDLVNNDLCFTELVRSVPYFGKLLRFKFQLALVNRLRFGPSLIRDIAHHAHVQQTHRESRLCSGHRTARGNLHLLRRVWRRGQ